MSRLRIFSEDDPVIPDYLSTDHASIAAELAKDHWFDLTAARRLQRPREASRHTKFLQRPQRWLEAISRYGASTSGGPNFAYDMLVKRQFYADISLEHLWYIDLERDEIETLNTEH